jgi:PAS domain S-box-containing protein
MAVNLDAAILTWITEFATQGILVTDTELVICGWNRWLETHSGRSAASMLGRKLPEVYPELIERKLDQFYWQALAGQSAVLAQRFHRYLLPMPLERGGSAPGEMQISLMQQSARIAPLWAGGQIAGTITVIDDVTERAAREEALRQSRDLLEVRVQERTAELAAATAQLQSLSRRLLEIQESERRAIARELYDEAGQVLTSLSLRLGMLERDESCPVALAERIHDLKQTVADVMEELHRLAVDLRPASLDRVGLKPALEQYIENFRRQTGLSAELVTMELGDERLPAESETTFYRVVQEALTNVARHAQAQHVGVIIGRRDDRVVAIIEDDGIGFDLAEVQRRDRLGLLGMRERLEMLGGTLTIETSLGAGTTIFAEAPDGSTPSHR